MADEELFFKIGVGLDPKDLAKVRKQLSGLGKTALKSARASIGGSMVGNKAMIKAISKELSGRVGRVGLRDKLTRARDLMAKALLKDQRIMSRALRKDGTLRKSIPGGKGKWEKDMAGNAAYLMRLRTQEANAVANLTRAENALANQLKARSQNERLASAAAVRGTQIQHGRQQRRYNAITGSSSKKQATASGMMGAGAGILGGAMAVGYALSGPVKAALDFDEAMTVVGAVSQLTSKELKSLSDEAQNLGIESVYSADEIAQSMKFLAQSGFSADRIKGSMGAIVDLAAAGGVEVEFMADKLAGIMKTFNIEGKTVQETINLTKELSDQIAWTANKSKVDIPEIAETIKYAGMNADQYKNPNAVKELLAMIGILGDKGLTSSMAGTSTRAMFVKMAAPSSQAKKEMDKVGLHRMDINGDMLPVTTILAELGDKMKGMGTARQMEILKKLFDIRAAGPAGAIIKALVDGDFTQAMKELNTESKGYAAFISKMRLENVNQQLDILWDNVKGIAISIMESVKPVLMVAIKSISAVLGQVNQMLKIPFIGRILSFALGVGGLAAMLIAISTGIALLTGGAVMFIQAIATQMALLQGAGLMGTWMAAKGITPGGGLAKAVAVGVSILLAPVKTITSLLTSGFSRLWGALASILMAIKMDQMSNLAGDLLSGGFRGLKGGMRNGQMLGSPRGRKILGMKAARAGKGAKAALDSFGGGFLASKVVGKLLGGNMAKGLFVSLLPVLGEVVGAAYALMTVWQLAIWGWGKLFGENTDAIKENTSVEKAKLSKMSQADIDKAMLPRWNSTSDFRYQPVGGSISTDKMAMYDQTMAGLATGDTTIIINAAGLGLNGETSKEVAAFLSAEINKAMEAQNRRANRGAFI